MAQTEIKYLVSMDEIKRIAQTGDWSSVITQGHEVEHKEQFQFSYDADSFVHDSVFRKNNDINFILGMDLNQNRRSEMNLSNFDYNIINTGERRVIYDVVKFHLYKNKSPNYDPYGFKE